TSCQVPQQSSQSTCDMQVSWHGHSTSGGPIEPLGNVQALTIQSEPPCLKHNGEHVACSEDGTRTRTVSVGHQFFTLLSAGLNGTVQAADAVIIGYAPYTKPFTWNSSTHNELAGDFDGNGKTDILVQPKLKSSQTGLFPQTETDQYISGFHQAWSGAHPQISSIEDWSEESYKAVVGNFKSGVENELLLLGHKNIILLHGDVITPIVTFPQVNNAIVSWDSNGNATHTEFEFDANPADYEIIVGDLSGDGYDEIFLQGKSKGSTSYILSNTGSLVQTLSNGYLNIDWSAAAYSASIAGGQIHLTALTSADNNNTVYTHSNGSISHLGNSVTSAYISGTPLTTVRRQQAYEFKPTINESGYSVTITATGVPSWATFDSSTGRISGTPSASDVGTSSTIKINVHQNKSYTKDVSLSYSLMVLENALPTLTILQPSNGDSIEKGDVIFVKADAADDVSLSAVEFWLNNDTSNKKVVTSAPFYAYFHAESEGVHTVNVKAIDHINQTTTQTRTINVTSSSVNHSSKPTLSAKWSPIRIRTGETATLNWNASNAIGCYDSDGNRLAASGTNTSSGNGVGNVVKTEIICANNKGVKVVQTELLELPAIADTLPAQITNPLDGQDSGTVVGSIPAEFSVKPSGAAVYEVPITVAPGSGGHIPAVALSYDSLSSNGIAGVGWQISGMSAITRCAKNIEQDNEAGALSFTANDRLCVNNKKLFPREGSYWGASTRYETEDKTSIKIVASSASGSYAGQTASFTEYHTNGTRTVYGNADSPIGIDGKIYVWPVYRQYDAAGNYIEYVYEQNSGELSFKLTKVLYTGNENTGSLPFNAINFEYEERPDDIYKFSVGYPVNVTKRLKRIISKVN
ncbi:MAG: putative Ig domain-containing protein, partial [Kangiellaceae bacterium]|nr:putative Ig domain-containing protein [Kangiellaceae bacterium]